jgi:hypothetical protein
MSRYLTLVGSALGAILTLLLPSCNQPKVQTQEELLAYVMAEDHGLVKSLEVNETQIKVIYRPTDLLAGQEVGQGEHPDPHTIAKVRNKYSPYYYFILSLSKQHKEIIDPAAQGFSQFSSLLQTVAFRLTDAVHLSTAKKDTIPVVDYYYQRTFGMGQSTDVLFAFQKAKAKGADWVEFNLDEFGLGIGKQSLRFKVQDLEKAPSYLISEPLK